jgi:hypothetical protein
MSVAELMNSVQYLIDANGDKKAVVLELPVWEEIVTVLERTETRDTSVEAAQDADRKRRNQLALKLLETRSAEPDEADQAWWDDFEQFLRENRFSLREVDLG